MLQPQLGITWYARQHNEILIEPFVAPNCPYDGDDLIRKLDWLNENPHSYSLNTHYAPVCPELDCMNPQSSFKLMSCLV